MAKRKQPAPRVEFADIPVEHLVVDDRNPRFATPAGQAELYARYAGSAKTHRLARHIVNNGLDPLSILGVNRLAKNRYVVREGNRRTAALRLLHDPGLAGAEKWVKRFEEIAAEGRYVPPVTVRCAVFDEERDAHEWMRVKHAGAQEGVGTESWSPLQTSRFNTRTGSDHQYAFAQQLVDEAIDDGLITEQQAEDVATSSLARVLNDSAVQQVLHVRRNGDRFVFGIEAPARERLARRLLADWSKGGKSVRDIDQREQRVDYAQELARELELRPVSIAEARTKSVKGAAKARSTPRAAGPRRVLIPGRFEFDDRNALPRIARVVKELRSLDLKKYPNAISMLFRLFVEASVDGYLKTHKIVVPPDRRGQQPALSVRVERAMDHLRVAKPAEKQALGSIRSAFGAKHGVFALATLHEYVHNPTWQPLPDNLRDHWDNYSEFMRMLWE